MHACAGDSWAIGACSKRGRKTNISKSADSLLILVLKCGATKSERTETTRVALMRHPLCDAANCLGKFVAERTSQKAGKGCTVHGPGHSDNSLCSQPRGVHMRGVRGARGESTCAPYNEHYSVQ